MRKKCFLSFLFPLCLLLAACGGGSSTGNALLDAEVNVYPVTSGGGEQIGERAAVEVDKSAASALTAEEFAAFCEQRVDGSGYNWFTVDFGDGTGLVFTGCNTLIVNYCHLDDEGMAGEDIGWAVLRDGVYSYEAA